jgi:hypothetical protein
VVLVDALADPGHLIKATSPAEDVGVVKDAFDVAFELAMVGGLEDEMAVSTVPLLLFSKVTHLKPDNRRE